MRGRGLWGRFHAPEPPWQRQQRAHGVPSPGHLGVGAARNLRDDLGVRVYVRGWGRDRGRDCGCVRVRGWDCGCGCGWGWGCDCGCGCGCVRDGGWGCVRDGGWGCVRWLAAAGCVRDGGWGGARNRGGGGARKVFGHFWSSDAQKCLHTKVCGGFVLSKPRRYFLLAAAQPALGALRLPRGSDLPRTVGDERPKKCGAVSVRQMDPNAATLHCDARSVPLMDPIATTLRRAQCGRRCNRASGARARPLAWHCARITAVRGPGAPRRDFCPRGGGRVG